MADTTNLYVDAVVEGVKDFFRQTNKREVPAATRSLGPEGPGYWIARRAARGTASALLTEAKRIGVTEEQWEALRAVAAEVAYD
jgi:hypothetical protein